MAKKNDSNRENFSDLIGTIKPIKKTCIDPQFHSSKKEKKQLIIESAEKRQVQFQFKKEISENFIDLPHFEIQKIKQKKVVFRKRIDLHGYLVNEAKSLLNDLLNFRQNKKVEYWMIIHGKGKHSPYYDIAPLKQEIITLLYENSAVGGIFSIHDIMGESGATAIAVRPLKK